MKTVLVAIIMVCVLYFACAGFIRCTAKDAMNDLKPAIDNFTTITDKLK